MNQYKKGLFSRGTSTNLRKAKSLKRTSLLIAALMATVLVAGAQPAWAGEQASAPTGDALAVGSGVFAGEIGIECVRGAVGFLDCSFTGASTLCVEFILGSPIGAACSVSYGGKFRVAVGTTAGQGSECLGVGQGTANITTQTQSYAVPITLVYDGASGSFAGAKISPPTASIRASFATFCSRGSITKVVEGEFTILDLGL